MSYFCFSESSLKSQSEMQSCKLNESESRPNVALRSIITIETIFFSFALLYFAILYLSRFIFLYMLMLELVPQTSFSNYRICKSILKQFE